MIGLSLGAYQYPEIRCKLKYTCTLCRQEIDSNESRIPREQQIEDLNNRLKEGSDYANPCLGCGQTVAFAHHKKYKARVEDLVESLKDQEARIKMRPPANEWSQDTKSLVGVIWLGWCPVDGAEMYANRQDFYECPDCHLQIHAIAGGPNVMPSRGVGKFRIRNGMRIAAVDELPGCSGFSITHDRRVKKS